MNKEKTKKLGFLPALVISVLAFGAFAGVASFLTKDTLGLALVSRAESGSDDEEEDKDDEDSDEDEDKEKEEKKKKEKEAKEEQEKAAKEKEKRAAEEAKRKTDIEREKMKKKTEELRKSGEGQGGNELISAEKEEKELQKAEEKALKEEEKLIEKKADILEDIYEEIFDAAERIEKARLEGIDVTKALATLDEARAKAKLAEQSLSASDIEAAKRLAKEVKKLAHFARNKDVHDARDVKKDIDKVAKRITQTEGKIFLYGSLGGDTGKFTEALDKAKDEFAALKDQIAQGGETQLAALSQLENLERRIKTIKSSVESAIFALGGTDEQFDDDHEDEIDDLFEDLNDVAEIEGDEIGEEIKGVALSQKESAKKVGQAVENIDRRNRVLQLLFGTKASDLNGLSAEIASNNARIQALTAAANKIEDEEVRAMLLEQVSSLKQETSKLETFVSGQKDRLSAFGWFLNLF